MDKLKLKFGLDFADLYSVEGLEKLDNSFIEYLDQRNPEMTSLLLKFRKEKKYGKELSQDIISMASFVEGFISDLFGIEEAVRSLKDKHDALANIQKCKRLFVQRQAVRDHRSESWDTFDDSFYREKIQNTCSFNEVDFSNKVMELLEDKEKNKEDLEIFSRYSAWAALSDNAKKHHRGWVIFDSPQKKDLENFFDINEEKNSEFKVLKLSDEELVSRDGFKHTSKPYSMKEVLNETDYCIYCHNTGKDSCSKGLLQKDRETGDSSIKKNVFGEELKGCPLEEKISEMNFLKSHNIHIGSLAAAIIDNPMIAGTGYRICNDCMKSCIYQKQDPVDIPKAETGILRDILNLPWGFEIYRLLTQWNPLKQSNYIVQPDTGAKVLVVGLGPSGFTLAHYLLTEGHTVVAVDGLKIEHLDPKISGIDHQGNRVEFEPIRDIKTIFEDLDERVAYGFGGVSEYGITVRWDKNFLKVIRLILERSQNFRMYGGVRFGGNITYDSAFQLGLDHIALSMGAGKPNILQIPNSVALGARTASDFLMALQLTGAARKSSIANLQIRLPAVVVGGGLTAIDTATEAMSYYVRQVEKFQERHMLIVSSQGKERAEEGWTDLDREIAGEFLGHASIFAKERELANQENRKPEFHKIIQQLGGVKVVYRQSMINSPSYRLNPEEVKFAFEEGIEFIENATPVQVKIDDREYVKSLECSIKGKYVDIPAKTLLVATGTNPNVSLNKEDPKNFFIDGKYFKLIDEGVFISKDIESKKSVTIFGDLHPAYKGNVVKAMASAKNHYKDISDILPKRQSDSKGFFGTLDKLLLATVYDVKILTDNIVEVIFKAPLSAQEFHPGQFYKLQNYNSFALKTNFKGKRTDLEMEGIALTGAWVDKEKGLISTIILEMGGSSDLCRFLKKGEPVVLMGPTGTPTEIKTNERVMLVGGGLGNAVLFSIGKALRDAGSKVLYFAGYKKMSDRYKVKEIEQAADQIIWCCDEGELKYNREEDSSFHGNIVEAISQYSENKFNNQKFYIGEIDRIISIGSDGMMAAVNQARSKQLADKLKKGHESIASINSPMQCMMKEICAQCLQRHVDPDTGIETYVYSCSNQDQNSDLVDFKHLKTRLSQNSLSEKLTAKWIKVNIKESAR